MNPRASIAVLIPAKNEEVNLPFALASVKDWAQQVFVLDSGSTDRTRQIAEEHGATFVFHEWEGYARQKNWGLDNLPITARWVFILDADETITSELAEELIRVASRDDCAENGFYVNRYLIFLGRRIRHCGYYPSWNVRFFRRGKARYEERQVHEHMIVDGPVGYLTGHMEHHDRRGLDHFIAKHNLYSTLEASELFKIERDVASGTMKFRFWGSPIERRRWIKHRIWPRVPMRSFVRWFYMYVLQLGFMDGRAGLHLCKLLADYEHQITLKLSEMRRKHSAEVSAQAVAKIADTYPGPRPGPLEEPRPQRIEFVEEGIETPEKKVEPAASEEGPEGVPLVDAQLMEQFGEGERWPYPKHIYVFRLIWVIVWMTLWKICWWRLPWLRTWVLRIFGAKVGSVGLAGSTWIEMPWDLKIGHGVIVGPRVHLYNLGALEIGDHTVISQDAYICGGTHDHTDPTYPLIRKKVKIGSYVWIAAGAFVHPGVTIGDGALVGARAVVTRDVEPWTIVTGNPAKVVKRRVMRTSAGAQPSSEELRVSS